MIWKIHPYKIKEMLINKKLAKFDYKILTELDWKVRPVVISRMCQSSAPEAEIQKVCCIYRRYFFLVKTPICIITPWLSLRYI